MTSPPPLPHHSPTADQPHHSPLPWRARTGTAIQDTVPPQQQHQPMLASPWLELRAHYPSPEELQLRDALIREFHRQREMHARYNARSDAHAAPYGWASTYNDGVGRHFSHEEPSSLHERYDPDMGNYGASHDARHPTAHRHNMTPAQHQHPALHQPYYNSATAQWHSFDSRAMGPATWTAAMPPYSRHASFPTVASSSGTDGSPVPGQRPPTASSMYGSSSSGAGEKRAVTGVPNRANVTFASRRVSTGDGADYFSSGSPIMAANAGTITGGSSATRPSSLEDLASRISVTSSAAFVDRRTRREGAPSPEPQEKADRRDQHGTAGTASVESLQLPQHHAESTEPEQHSNNVSSLDTSRSGEHKSALERNREAAKKSRAKRKRELDTLEQRTNEAQAQNDHYRASINALKREMVELSEQLLCHRACGCVPVQRYIHERMDMELLREYAAELDRDATQPNAPISSAPTPTLPPRDNAPARDSALVPRSQ